MESAGSPHPVPPRALRRWTQQFAGVRRDIKRRLGILAPLRIALYGGYGSSGEVIVRGRVLEERTRPAPTAADSPLVNFRRAYWQLESDEVPGVGLQVRAATTSAEVTSDADGYFAARLSLTGAVDAGWLPVEVNVTRAPYPVRQLAEARGAVLIPSARARFGVISDIDDTILRTHVTNRVKMVYLTLLWNAYTRRSFDGTTALYRGLEHAGGGAPFFYLSRSIWNIFPLLEHFIDYQGLPRGPLILRQASLFERPLVPHKPRFLRELLATYPALPFVLIGDSGEHDLGVYLEAARTHPGRIHAILIRNVSSSQRLALLREQAGQAALVGCPVLFFDESKDAISECERLGLWSTPPLDGTLEDRT